MISYSAMKAYALLYSSYNEIDIYVEDKTLVGMYERIFKHHLINKYHVEAVIPFGKKSDVINEHLRLRNDNTRNRLFIVDGDFDWIHTSISHDKLYELQTYSIENFAFEDNAMLSFAGECSPEKNIDDVLNTLNIPQIDSEIRLLRPLMIAYTVARALGSGLSTISYNLERLNNAASKQVDPSKVRGKVLSFYKALCKEYSLEIVRDFKKEIEDKLVNEPNADRRIIAGKHYGLKIIHAHMRRKFRFTGKTEHLLAAIVERSNLEVDPHFKTMLDRL